MLSSASAKYIKISDRQSKFDPRKPLYLENITMNQCQTLLNSQNANLSTDSMSDRRSKKACETCKRRKKRCSGGLPCDYCTKIDKPQECEYHTRVSSKTVKITEKYLLSLKTRIRDLEHELNNTASPCTSEYLPDTNPLVSSEDDNVTVTNELLSSSSEVSVNLNNYPFGDSACAKYLFKIRQLLIRSCELTCDVRNSDFKTISLDTSPNISLIEVIASEVCPSIEQAKKWISAASKIIGADYMFIEPNYEKDILESVIYNSEINHVNFVEYATELTRFFTYLALGCLFNEDNSPENARSKFPGLLYFETALKLQGELSKVYDRVANSSLVQSFLYVAYYALSLDKSSFAFILVGNAIRMMFTLGYHRRVTSSINNRIFWLCYVYDRLVAVRFGFPLTINEFDIEIPLLTEADHTFFSVSLDIYHFVSQVKLAKITTQIVKKIYTRNSVSFIQNCNVVLKMLKNWLDDLPSDLRLDYNNFNTGGSRSTINLHINYNYSIIITTRPVLFYVFNKVVATGKSTEELFSRKLLNVIQSLLESSVQAAQIQSLVLTKLYYEGKMVNASFLDCHYIFNATIILIFAACCEAMPNYAISFGCDISTLFERVQINLKVLQRLSQYNISACNFNRQLTEIIELISSQEVQTTLKGFFQPPSNIYTTLNEDVTNNPVIDLDLVRNLDLTRVLDDIIDTSNSSESILFDNEDFLKYSNSFIS